LSFVSLLTGILDSETKFNGRTAPPPPPPRQFNGRTAPPPPPPRHRTAPRRHMWSQVKSKNEGPGTRAAHSCDLLGNNLYVFGGWNGKKALNDLYVLNFLTLNWRKLVLTGNGPQPRNNHSIAMVGMKLFIHGGHDGIQWLADLYTLNTDTGRWDLPTISGTHPSSRACHTLTRVVGEDKLYMFGGYDGAKLFNDVDILDLRSMSWIQPNIAGTKPKARNAHTMTSVGTTLFLFGGHSGNTHLQDVHILDTTIMQWDSPNIGGTPPPGIRGHTSTIVSNKIYIFGGYDGRRRSNSLHILNLELSQWEHVHVQKNLGSGGSSSSSSSSSSAPPGRQRHTACLVGSQKLLIYGGFDGLKWREDMHLLDVGKLDEGAITSNATSNLLMNMKRLLNNSESFSDVTFIVEGRPLYAHRNILSVQCDHFHAMFGVREREEKVEIIIPNSSYAAFHLMLEFLYTGSIVDLDVGVSIDLLGLADQYTLQGLLALAENVLINHVDSVNCCWLFRCANRFQCHNLKEISQGHIIKHFDTVSLTDSFANLEPTLLLDITRERCKYFKYSS
jgi:N-acetylneuraminic acid mutarotase